MLLGTHGTFAWRYPDSKGDRGADKMLRTFKHIQSSGGTYCTTFTAFVSKVYTLG